MCQVLFDIGCFTSILITPQLVSPVSLSLVYLNPTHFPLSLLPLCANTLVFLFAGLLYPTSLCFVSLDFACFLSAYCLFFLLFTTVVSEFTLYLQYYVIYMHSIITITHHIATSYRENGHR